MEKMLARFWEDFHKFTATETSFGPNIVYRGVSKSSYKLLSSLSRVNTHQISNEVDSLESNLISEFKRLALPELKSQPTTDFEWLFLAQHYGLPTRLLDWTINPLIALFFAVEKNDGEDAKIFRCAHPLTYDYERFDYRTAEIQEKLKHPLDILHGMNYGKVLFIQPPYKDARYINQKSIFSCQAKPLEPLDVDSITELVIDRTLKFNLREQLRVMGISHSFVYPGLEGVSAEITKHVFDPVNEGRRMYGPIARMMLDPRELKG